MRLTADVACRGRAGHGRPKLIQRTLRVLLIQLHDRAVDVDRDLGGKVGTRAGCSRASSNRSRAFSTASSRSLPAGANSARARWRSARSTCLRVVRAAAVRVCVATLSETPSRVLAASRSPINRYAVAARAAASSVRSRRPHASATALRNSLNSSNAPGSERRRYQTSSASQIRARSSAVSSRGFSVSSSSRSCGSFIEYHSAAAIPPASDPSAIIHCSASSAAACSSGAAIGA